MKKYVQKLVFVMGVLLCLNGYTQTGHLQQLQTFLKQNQARYNLNPGDYKELVITRDYNEKNSGINRIYAQQKINGIDVQGGIVSIHTNTTTGVQVGTSNLLALHNYIVDAPLPALQPDAAVRKALASVEIEVNALSMKTGETSTDFKTIFKRNDQALWDVPARLVYLPNDKLNKLQLVWEVQVYEFGRQHYWVIHIDDKTGKVVKKTDLVLHCNFGGGGVTDNEHTLHNHALVLNSHEDYTTAEKVTSTHAAKGQESITAIANNYKVYDMPIEAPNDPIAAHTLVANAGDNVASPDGWHRVANSTLYNYTRGNNVWAFYDPSPGPLGGAPNNVTVAYNNGGPAGTPTLTEPFTFNFPVDLTKEPDTYRNAAIVNLFYWNNLIHDVFYQFGFTEEAGNFQESHTFSTGTRGNRPQGQNDAVLAQAQDGGGTNNANFLTLQDGAPASAQMQMYLWTSSSPDSLVHITSSTSGIPPAATRYFAIQGVFNTNNPDTNDLHNHPVLNREFVIIQKNQLSTVGSSSEGCTSGQQSVALPPSNNVSNKIVLIDRGSCSFVEKVSGAQQGGAAGVIVINNVDGPPITMGGSDAPGQTINIPAVMVSKSVGDVLKAQLRAGATIIGSLKQNFPILPKRDGDFDNAVIGHEYGHGISNRLTAGPDALLPLGGDEQGGEGWSDFIGLFLITRTNDLLPATSEHPNGVLPNKGIGTYVTYQGIEGAGIRPTRYSIDMSINPSTFKDIARGGEITVPHGVGYIWCTMLYEMEQLFIDQYGFNNDPYFAANPDASGAPATGSGGNSVAMRLVMEGMKLQPASPTFQQQRDAILKADSLLYGGRHSCTIWRAFAKRGLGFSAQSNSNSLGDEIQAFDLPFSCDPNQARINLVMTAPERIDNNTLADFTVSVKNIGPSTISNLTVSDSIPANTALQFASDGGTQSGDRINWSINSLAPNQTKNLTYTINVGLPSATISIFNDNHDNGPSNWTPSPGANTWVYQNNKANAYSGNNYWYAREVENPTHNVSLTQNTSVAIPAGGAKLAFYHKYNTEEGYDGGFIEISANNGATWTYLPPTKFEKNGYNSIITTANNPNVGTTDKAAFSGATLGYISSVADLSDYAGQSIRVRFRYTCDVASLASGPNPGWYLDDVLIIRNLTEITSVATANLQTDVIKLFDSTGNMPRTSASAVVFENSVLPITWSALQATNQKNHIRLTWSTTTEVFNSGFDVERKADNEAEFTKIGFVKGAGTSNQKKNYMYNDVTAAAGENYQYRIKQTDKDGKFTYSNIAVGKLGRKDMDIVFDILPNPVTDVANFIVSTPGRKNGFIRIFDALGKPVVTLNAAQAYNELQKFQISVRGLNPGTYWVELSADGAKLTRPLVISR